ncbi:aldehyde dehydrogenase domain-containing protein [Sordaria brevicollis]|uniref:aldehyde dehydrogenase (NAD(+)) n=1 Tax=Sordaria brevicollis TaxID=83679 RepID=A0AAE0PMB2_SORBR|nr:aldehyde dehydrogenase domain-containing protein [Sordaria brevicollis]
MSTTVNVNGIEFQPKLLINGEFVEASDKATFNVINPLNGSVSCSVPEATEDDTNRAVAAAKAAQPAWAALDPTARGACLKKLASLLREHKPTLAHLEAISMGVPLTQYFHADIAAEELDYFSEAWPHIQGQSSINTPGYVTMTLRQPFGVVACIIPWNAPVFFFAVKAAAALITGNTVVVKSSEKAPLAVAFASTLITQAGFPPGVFNVLSGHGVPSGRCLARHMEVRALSFTGSSRTGKLIQEEAAKTNLKSVTLELGGKSPAIVFEDAPDLEAAVAATVAGFTLNAGQFCIANSRVYVQASIAEKFTKAFVKHVSAIKGGDPLEATTGMGPQADEIQYKTILSYIESGKQSGTLAAGGNGKLDSTKGYFIEPTVFRDSPEDSKIVREEIFGPVVNINTFETEEEVVAKANDTEFGLYASVFTKDISRAMRMAKALESGYVAVNCSSPTQGRDLPFGGWKGSGQGREGKLYSMDHFMETKSVVIKLD